MAMPRDAMLLRVFIGECAKCHRRPLYKEIVLKAREARLAGATVLRGPMGFGHSTRLHSTKILDVREELAARHRDRGHRGQDKHRVGEVAAAEGEDAGQIPPVGTGQQPEGAEKARRFQNRMLAFAHQRDDRQRRQNSRNRGQPEDHVEGAQVRRRRSTCGRRSPAPPADRRPRRRCRRLRRNRTRALAPMRGRSRSAERHAAAISSPVPPIRQREPEGSRATRRTLRKARWSRRSAGNPPPPRACGAPRGRRSSRRKAW